MTVLRRLTCRVLLACRLLKVTDGRCPVCFTPTRVCDGTCCDHSLHWCSRCKRHCTTN